MIFFLVLFHMLLGVDSNTLAWKRMQSDGSFEHKACDTTMSLSEVVNATDLKGFLRKGFWFCGFFFFLHSVS